MALANRALGARPIGRIRGQPRADLAGVLLEARDARLRFGGQIRLNREPVRFAMPREHRRRRGFQFLIEGRLHEQTNLSSGRQQQTGGVLR